MIRTDKFLFVHFFRTGGTYMNNFLLSHMAGEPLGYHKSLWHIDDEDYKKPIIGNVRNPWDWYVSVYYHALNLSYPMATNTFLNKVIPPEKGKYSFKETIKKLLNAPKGWSSLRMDQTIHKFPDEPNWNKDNQKMDNITKHDLVRYLGRNDDTGFFSFLFEHMYVEGPFRDRVDEINFCKLENLYDDWSKHLPEDLIDTFKNFPRGQNGMMPYNLTNTSYLKHFYSNPFLLNAYGYEQRDKDYRTYYDDELRDLVYEKDKKWIEYFNYQF